MPVVEIRLEPDQTYTVIYGGGPCSFTSGEYVKGLSLEQANSIRQLMEKAKYDGMSALMGKVNDFMHKVAAGT